MDNFDFKCPITQQILLNPVVASDSHIYEKTAFEIWVKDHKTSPFTGLELKNKNYHKCFIVDKLLENFLKQNPELVKDQYMELFNFKNFIKLYNENLENAEAYLDKYNEIKIDFNDLPKNIYKNNNLMKKIIDKCDDLERGDNGGWKPIHYICKFSTPEIIKYVIDKEGVNLECENNDKCRPIHFICRFSTPEMIKYIIDKGVDLECEDNYKWRPIHYICKFSTPEMIKYIINKGVDLECEDIDKWRPIHIICQYSTPEMIKYIIDKGVDLECEDNNKCRPIHYICKFSTLKMIKYIIDKGVDLECVDNNK